MKNISRISKHCTILLHLILVFTCCLFTSNLLAQDVYTIIGRVMSYDRKPINNVTLAITGIDNAFKQSLLLNDGQFSYKTKENGTYKFTFSAMGLDSASINIILTDNKNIAVPDVLLNYKVNNLDQVTITSKKPLIELKNNKLIYNVPATASSGFTAFEILKKVPGITIDGNNNILIKGQSGVKVMINNKMMELGQAELTSILQSKTSDDIDNIEVMTIPSSKYDAAGSGGIINLNLKKVKKESFNGSVSSTFAYGKSPKYNNAINLSYQEKKLSSYASFSVINDEFERNLFAERSIRNNSYQNYFSDTSKGKMSFDTYSFLIGADYNVGKFGNLGVSLNGNSGDTHINNNVNTLIGENKNSIDSLLNSIFDTKQKKNNLNYSAFYTYKNDKDQFFSATVDYASFENEAEAIQPNQYYSIPERNLLSTRVVEIDNKTNIDIYAVKLDFELPVMKGKLAFGTKTSQVTTRNLFNYFNVEEIGSILNPDQSNRFDYRETINAGYASYNLQKKRFAFEFGLRAERTLSNGILIPILQGAQQRTENKRTYIDLFPSGSINLKLDSINTIAFAYGRRVDRPNYQTLNPFEFRTSELVSNKGNLNLKPQYTDKFTITYILGSTFTTSIGLSTTSDLLNQFVDTLEGRKIVYFPINLGRVNNLYYDFNHSLQLGSLWRMNNYASLAYNTIKAELPNGEVNNSIVTYYLNSAHEITLGKYTANLSAYFIGPFYYGTFRNEGLWGVDVGLQKKILHDRGNITFNGVNILNTMIYRSHLNYGGVLQSSRDENENRLFKISLSYKFNSKNIASRKHKTATEDESKRTR